MKNYLLKVFLIFLTFLIISSNAFSTQLFYDSLDSASTISANNGTITSDANFVQGLFGNAFEARKSYYFSKPSTYITYPTSGKFNPKKGTISFWIKPYKFGDGPWGNNGFWDVGKTGTGNSLGLFGGRNNGGNNDRHTFDAWLEGGFWQGGADYNYYYRQTTTYTQDWQSSWHFVSARWDCTSSDNNFMGVGLDGGAKEPYYEPGNPYYFYYYYGGYTSVLLSDCNKLNPIDENMWLGSNYYYGTSNAFYDEFKVYDTPLSIEDLNAQYWTVYNAKAPKIVSASSIGTVIAGTPTEFSVSATDPNGLPLQYYFYLDGNIAGNSSSFSATFDKNGMHTVNAVVYNGLFYSIKTWPFKVFSTDPNAVSNPPKEQIQWLLSQQSMYSTGLVDSFQDDNDSVAHTYDQALAIIAFTKAGKISEAKKILDFFKNHQLSDGSFYSAYDGLTGNQWVYNSGKTGTGEITWLLIAFNYYEASTGDSVYSEIAKKLSSHLLGRINRDKSKEYYGSINMNNYSSAVISTEHQFDAYSAFKNRALLTTDFQLKKNLDENAQIVLNYVMKEEYSLSANSNKPSTEAYFFRGYNDFIGALDTQSWAVLSIGKIGPNGEDLAKVLDYANGKISEAVDFSATIPYVRGFGFDDSTAYYNSIWVEGTEQMAEAYNVAENTVQRDFFHNQIGRIVSANSGLSYSFQNSSYYSFPYNYRNNSIASTAWYYFADNQVNPFEAKMQFPQYLFNWIVSANGTEHWAEIVSKSYEQTSYGRNTFTMEADATVNFYILINNSWKAAGSLSFKKGDVVSIEYQKGGKVAVYKNDVLLKQKKSFSYKGIKATYDYSIQNSAPVSGNQSGNSSVSVLDGNKFIADINISLSSQHNGTIDSISYSVSDDSDNVITWIDGTKLYAGTAANSMASIVETVPETRQSTVESPLANSIDSIGSLLEETDETSSQQSAAVPENQNPVLQQSVEQSPASAMQQSNSTITIISSNSIPSQNIVQSGIQQNPEIASLPVGENSNHAENIAYSDAMKRILSRKNRR